MLETLQKFAKTQKTMKKARKNEKNCKFSHFFTPRGQKTPIFAIFAIFCHFLGKFENAVTFVQIITERCLTPEMKDLVQYFKVKKKAGSYLFFLVFQNFALNLPKN
jgi:hypothetical protein